ncbi:phosphotransferase family protein [Williamsia sterculiae]|uniref:Predicted kinase, aminoglycoside phosphotransferase (APT) family n=1 Tax=Williamsia sterculiae TaxID=1344003 RepID=A0A1N7HCW9_9NOCA|nr:phosphotransferase family protein [Williamsia sterculiae]SIS22727.1 Predicted kinase, aminoglycoside phosphotransferase (APT) family [Williamsia sterculiae]
MPEAALRGFLVESGVPVEGDLQVELISGGRSNLTFSVRDDLSHWVVRRPPTGGLTPSAHDMAREWTVTHALQDTVVPVAGTIAADLTGDAIGAPFTVVEFVDGNVIRSAEDLQTLGDDDIDRNADTMIRTLADLHAIDHRGVGLSEFGRPTGFAARQVKLWSRQWGHVKTRDLDDVEVLADALAEAVPESAAESIVHGDFRVDNTVLDTDDPGVVRAVVDWEMSTLGDPLTDVALMCVYREPVFDRVLGFRAAWTSGRYPDADTLAQRYATLTGHDLPHWGFYLALANFKLGIIAEGITHRALNGASSDDGADRAAAATPEFIAAGLRALRRGD